jgi:RND family efflux transporter MFP subunit
MSRVNPWLLAAAAVLLALVGLVSWRLLSAPKADDDASPSSALVTLAPARRANVNQTVSAYGVITGSPAASRTVAAPRAVVVLRLLVAPGEAVAAGAPLAVIADTPASALAFRQAADAVTFAQRDLERVQRLYDQQLAAADQLGAAQKTLADAKAVAAAQSALGSGGKGQTLTAPQAGIVGAIPVAMGDHVAADAPLMSIIAVGGLTAQLGVEPALAGKLAPGQSVALASALDPRPGVTSRLSLVGHAVDTASRLVNVTAPASALGLPLGAAVKGEITIASHPGLLVPHGAVVFDEDGAHLFLVKGGKAREVAVTAGPEQGDDIEVIGALQAGDAVAVQGADQIQDGQAVRTAP